MLILKGKTVRSKPASVVEDYVAIPRELLKFRDIALCVDCDFHHQLEQAEGCS